MRRLGMKNKRRKSDTMSDSETEEHGGNDIDETSTTGNKGNSDASSGENASTTAVVGAGSSPATRKSAAMKKRPRGSAAQHKSEARDAASENDDDDDDETADEPERENGKVPSNKRRKKETKASTSARDKKTTNEDNEYEVSKIVGHRTIKGRRQFLVRWKNYSESADTWENEKDLNCQELMEEYLSNEQEGKTPPKLKPKTEKSKKTKNNSKKAQNDDQNDKETLKEFEVEKIIEVHFKKNGKRDFLIRWKGFSAADNTWEPEENLNCPELIDKFMQKLEKMKTADVRELRTNRAHTKRYTLSTHDSGRRLSRRHLDKQRATYHECDD